ncbi:MAG: hypothetical protein OXE02_07585 [Chloroflexi bacterium]|nr:hypothetical protein [Chloroflexota bacterium]
MLIADLIMEMQERPVKPLTVFVDQQARLPLIGKCHGLPARGAAYEYEAGFLIFRADVPSIDLEMNDELTIYARIAYPMPVMGLRTLDLASKITDGGGCYCGTCIEGRLELALDSIRP